MNAPICRPDGPSTAVPSSAPGGNARCHTASIAPDTPTTPRRRSAPLHSSPELTWNVASTRRKTCCSAVNDQRAIAGSSAHGAQFGGLIGLAQGPPLAAVCLDTLLEARVVEAAEINQRRNPCGARTKSELVVGSAASVDTEPVCCVRQASITAGAHSPLARTPGVNARMMAPFGPSSGRLNAAFDRSPSVGRRLPTSA